MKSKITLLLLATSTIFTNKILGQDLIRVSTGAAYDFRKNRVSENFSLDFNRTEKIDEQDGVFLFISRKKDYYIRPTLDVNIGDGVTASENNVLFQLNMGKSFVDTTLCTKNSLRKSGWNKKIELNPSFNSDKIFQEKSVFGQVRLSTNLISSKYTDQTMCTRIKSEHSLVLGGVSNLGYRYSKLYHIDAFYSTAGVQFDYQSRILDSNEKDVWDAWIFGVAGSYYYIISDIPELTSDNFAGLIKASIDRYIRKNIYVGLSYKYGNDNPEYSYVHTLALSAKITY